MAAKCVLLIIGAGRSGTSAIARVLSLSGCTLPNSVLGKTEINEKGMWEPLDVWRLNEEFMFSHGTLYGDPSMRLQELSAITECDKEAYINRVQAFLSALEGGEVFIIKNPLITEFLPFWIEAATRTKVAVKAIVPIRHPQGFSASISAAGGREIPPELTNAFWLKQNLLAEIHSRDLTRVFVEYSSLMADWRVEIRRLSRVLQLDLTPNAAAINEFLTPTLYHQRCAGPIVETFGYPWLKRVYSTLSAAALDAPLNLDIMDEVYEAYRANERTFRIALSEFRGLFATVDPKIHSQALIDAPVLHKGLDYC